VSEAQANVVLDTDPTSSHSKLRFQCSNTAQNLHCKLLSNHYR